MRLQLEQNEMVIVARSEEKVEALKKEHQRLTAAHIKAARRMEKQAEIRCALHFS